MLDVTKFYDDEMPKVDIGKYQNYYCFKIRVSGDTINIFSKNIEFLEQFIKETKQLETKLNQFKGME